METPRSIAEVHRGLLDAGVIFPVAPEDERLWADCDLASLAENRLGDLTDPRALDDARRRGWRDQATLEPEMLPSAREYERCYWLADEGRSAGTLALGTVPLGQPSLRLSSFYVLPTERSRGLGQRALAACRRAAANQGLPLRLETAWTWQRTVRFYLRAGMWVRMWKRDLDLFYPPSGLAPLVEVGSARATLAVEHAGATHLLVEALREDDVLAAFTSHHEPSDPEVRALAWDADSTLSLFLALHGWPLLRKETFKGSSYSDAGPPEALARRIQGWEAWAVKRGYRIATPRIPNLEYPLW